MAWTFESIVKRFQLEPGQMKSGRHIVRGDTGQLHDLDGIPCVVIPLATANEQVRKLAFRAAHLHSFLNAGARLRKSNEKLKAERVRHLTQFAEVESDDREL